MRHDLVVTEPEPTTLPAPDGFWSTVGQGVLAGVRGVGRGLSTAFYAVDPDARRDIAQVPLMALTSLGPRQAPVDAQPDDGYRPVVYVHGLGGHRGNFLPMRAAFLLRGRRRAYAVGLPWDGDIAETGRLLARHIEEICAVNELGPDGQVDIVAHSMGGVVARAALVEVGTAARVHTLVTLGTPHAGTQAARFAATTRCLDLRPESAFMARLATQVPWRSTTRLVCLWSASDPMMQPAHTARVDGADNRELTGFSHINYLLRRDGWAAVWDALEPTTPSRDPR